VESEIRAFAGKIQGLEVGRSERVDNNQKEHLMSTEMTENPEIQRETPTKSSLSRIIGVFLSPKETFEDINRKPDWLIPAILIVLVTLAATFVFMSHADMGDLINQQLEKQGKPPLPAEALEKALPITTVFTYGAIIVGVPISFLLVAGILYMVFSFVLGAETTYKKVFCANIYASMISLLKSLLAIPILFVKQPTEFGNPADVVQSNLGILFDPASKALHALGKSLDVFTIWYLIVLAIGMVGVSKGLTFKNAMITLGALFAIIVVCTVGWMAFRG
jgi:hypothetical protein